MELSLRSRNIALLSISALFITVLHSAFQGIPSPSVIAEGPFNECSDGADNDDDGIIDYPQDEGCYSLQDDSEGPKGSGLFISMTDGRDAIEPGDSSVYVIHLRTDRPGGMTTDVRFLIPHQASSVEGQGGFREGAYIIWPGVYLPEGVARRLQVHVNVSPEAEKGLLMVAEVRAEGEKATDTTRVEDTRIVPRTPLIITVDDGRDVAEPTEILTYHVVVENPADHEQTFTLHLDLPPQLSFLEASGPFRRDNRFLEWENLHLRPGEVAEFSVTAYIERNTPDFFVIRVRAAAGAAIGSDATSVKTGYLPRGLSAAVSDMQKSAVPGEEITYLIELDNRDPVLATDLTLTSTLPTYMEFVGASEGGYWTGDRVMWKGLTVSPNGSRDLHVTGRIRSDAPLGTPLRNVVRVAGHETADVTLVSTLSDREEPQRNLIGRANDRMMIRKTADRSEVRPGDTVTFTVQFRNTTGRDITGVRVEDRMDTAYMRLIGSMNGTLQNGMMIWNIPRVAAGETWETRYTVQIAASAPHGIELSNIVTVSGEGLRTSSLTERVYTSRVGVVTRMPKTGAANDILFVGFTSLLGIAQVAAQRRRFFF